MSRTDFDKHYNPKINNILFRWVDNKKKQLLKENIKEKGLKIADFGCGSGNVTSIITNKNKVYGVDFNKKLLKIAEKKGLIPVFSKIEHTPFKDLSTDLVIMVDAIEHIHSREKLAKEIRRILKKDGRLILFTPCYDSITWNLGEKFVNYVTKKKSDHNTPFTKESMEFFLNANKFRIEKIKKINFGLGLFAIARKI